MFKFLGGEIYKGVKLLARTAWVVGRVSLGEIVNAHRVLLSELFADDPHVSRPTRRE